MNPRMDERERSAPGLEGSLFGPPFVLLHPEARARLHVCVEGRDLLQKRVPLGFSIADLDLQVLVLLIEVCRGLLLLAGFKSLLILAKVELLCLDVAFGDSSGINLVGQRGDFRADGVLSGL
jgi:hypothetical protein